MRERPIGDLVVGLKQLGADVDCFLGTDCPPVRVVGKGGLPGGKVSLSFSQNIILAFYVKLLQQTWEKLIHVYYSAYPSSDSDYI